jgi:PilZ domain
MGVMDTGADSGGAPGRRVPGPRSDSQPTQPRALPNLVRVVVAWGKEELLPATVLRTTPEVVLLQGEPGADLPPIGAPVRVHVDWDKQRLHGRVAAHGQRGRYLVSLGFRAIRRAPRVRVDLPAAARAATPHGLDVREVRIVEFSSSGARLEGLELAVGAELNLSFTPLRQARPVTVRAVVVRLIEGAQPPQIGVVFRLAALPGRALSRMAD